eukprot:Gb_27306 [translate_table: standard]
METAMRFFHGKPATTRKTKYVVRPRRFHGLPVREGGRWNFITRISIDGI